MRWLFFRFSNWFKRIFKTIYFHIYYLCIFTNFFFLLKTVALLGCCLIFGNYLQSYWQLNLYLIQFVYISVIYVFIFEFLLYNKSAYYTLFSHKFIFFFTILFFSYLCLLYSLRPAWCICLSLNICLSCCSSYILNSYNIYPNIFSIHISRYILVYKLFIYNISLIFTILLYFLSIRRSHTIVDVLILYLTKIIAFVQAIIF